MAHIVNNSFMHVLFIYVLLFWPCHNQNVIALFSVCDLCQNSPIFYSAKPRPFITVNHKLRLQPINNWWTEPSLQFFYNFENQFHSDVHHNTEEIIC